MAGNGVSLFMLDDMLQFVDDGDEYLYAPKISVHSSGWSGSG